MAGDPYKTLGISPAASDSELRSAYRRLVRLHHPDHNGGSAESTRRFEEIQEAYAQVREQRASAGGPRASSREQRASSRGTRQAPPTRSPDPGLDAQLAEMERQLREARAERERAMREARAARERAMQDARAAAAADSPRRATDEELGYVTTDDSFTKIFDDAVSELSHWFEERRKPQH